MPERAKWFPRPSRYGGRAVRDDLLAGITVGVLLIPQAMAYGLLAGLPPVYGLYAALVPLVVYSLLASTPHVNVGPTALASLLCLNGIAELAEPGSAHYILLAVGLAALTGAFQLAFGALRMGGLVSLLSRPVLSGFVSAAAVLIVASQLAPLLGLAAPRAALLFDIGGGIFGNLTTFHWPTAALGLGTLVALWLGRTFVPRFPTVLAWIVVTTLVVFWFRLDRLGIAVVGDLPSGLPSFSLPRLPYSEWLALIPTALVLSLISFVETLSIGNTFAAHHGYYRVNPNRELAALGFSKLLGAAFSAIPTSASFSRSAVVEEGGGRSPLSGLVAAALLAIVLVFFTGAFYFLPLSMLAAVIIFSVGKLFDLAEMRRLYRLAPKELTVLLVTFFFTLFTGLQYGIAGGVVLSLAFVFLRAARPHLAELGRIPGTNAFRNVNRFDNVEIDPALLIVRFDAELYFGNAEYFGDRILSMADDRGEVLEAVILDGHTINDLDTTGLYALEQLFETLSSRRIKLYLAGVIGPVRDVLYRSGLMERMGTAGYFLSIQDAIRHHTDESDGRSWDLPAFQHE